jgi:hypothetical protein
MIRTYSEFRRLKTFEERYRYLRLTGVVGESTFGFDRYLNQMLYTSRRWLRTRDGIIIRDQGCDLGIRDYEIHGRIIIHHMNPITIEELEINDDKIFDPEFLITTSYNTHNAIHFGSESLLPQQPIERRPNDTCPWR